MTNRPNKDYLRRLFLDGVARCSAERVLPQHLPKTSPRGRTIVLGAGKAAAAMAAVAAEHLTGEVIGAVVTRYGHGTTQPTGKISVAEAGHPYPDDNSVAATKAIIELARRATEDDHVIILLSGGGSALLAVPIDGWSLEDKIQATRALLAAGAPITEINMIRKHLSRVKGGQLSAYAHRAQQTSFAISDVVGDQFADIASGPTSPMRHAPKQAVESLEQYGVQMTDIMRQAILKAPRSPARQHPQLVVARNADALQVIEQQLLNDGYKVEHLGSEVIGDASDTGMEHARLAQQISLTGEPTALLSGGELTVQLTCENGRGGPNLEYLAAFAQHIEAETSYTAMAGDSDGIDGTEDNAGAYIDTTSLDRCREKQINFEDLRRTHRTYEIFERLGDLIVTGPTLTNINDIRIILINPMGNSL